MSKLSAYDCDMLRSFANNGDAAGLIAFVEERYGQVDIGSDQTSGSAAQATGDSAGAKDTGKKAKSGG